MGVEGYTSNVFQAVSKAQIACNNADRAYLRRWILRWVYDYGRIHPTAERLSEKGC